MDRRIAGDRGAELEEVIGYHLEQAYRYRSELAPVIERERDLAIRAGLAWRPPGRGRSSAATSPRRPTC